MAGQIPTSVGILSPFMFSTSSESMEASPSAKRAISRLKPEILAPAGDSECLRAAVAAGADAVYLGLRRFNARGRAENFKSDVLPAHVQYAHSWGARVYVVLNTLVFEDELPVALRMAAEVRDAEADGVIVQDLGLFVELSRRVPELKRLASTQMTVHNVRQAEALADLGVHRIILAREMGVAEIASITRAMGRRGVGTEVFVHGALCFSYSGQCLMSNMAGARSANRGVCAQNCRMHYSLSGETGRSVAEGALLSMKDLATFRVIPDLLDAGVASFKIEGRLKRPEYVAVVTRLYSEAVDAAFLGRRFDSDAAVEKCSLVFNRGFTDGWLRDEVVPEMRAIRPGSSGVGEPYGVVLFADRHRGRLRIDARRPIHNGQGFAYTHGTYRGGFLVTRVASHRGALHEVDVRFGAERVPPIPKGQPIFVNSDLALYEEARAIYARHDVRREPLEIRVAGSPGRPLVVEARTERGDTAIVRSEMALEIARGRALDEALLREKLGRLGESRFELAALDARELRDAAFLPPSELNRLRRDLVTALESTRAAGVAPPRPLPLPTPAERRPRALTTRLAVAVAGAEAAARAIAAGADLVYLDIDSDLQSPDAKSRLAPLVEWVEQARPGAVLLKTPLVTDPEIHRRYLDSFPGIGIVASNLGVLRDARDEGRLVVADHYLNAYNSRAIEALSDLGAARVTLSFEVHAKEAIEVSEITLAPLELIVHGRVPVMTARALFGLHAGEEGVLVSENGNRYAVREHSTGHSVIFEGRELVGLPIVAEVRGALDVARLDVAHHTSEAIETVTRIYRAALDSGAYAAADGERLKKLAGGRIFLGHLKRGVRELDFVDTSFASKGQGF